MCSVWGFIWTIRPLMGCDVCFFLKNLACCHKLPYQRLLMGFIHVCSDLNVLAAAALLAFPLASLSGDRLFFSFRIYEKKTFFPHCFMFALQATCGKCDWETGISASKSTESPHKDQHLLFDSQNPLQQKIRVIKTVHPAQNRNSREEKETGSPQDSTQNLPLPRPGLYQDSQEAKMSNGVYAGINTLEKPNNHLQWPNTEEPPLQIQLFTFT